MFVKSIKLVKKAIFPIFRFETLGNNQFKVGVVGAGFFINSNGIFVTVAHVFDDTNKNVSFKYWGILPDKIHNPNLNIVEIVRDNNLDIFIGKIDIKTRNYLHFQKKIPDIGKSVCIAGYPLAAITDNQQGGLELGGVRRYFQPTFVLDRAVRHVTSNAVREASYRVEMRTPSVTVVGETTAVEVPSAFLSPGASSTATQVETTRDLGLNPRYKFENFIVGKGNELAHAAAMAAAANPGESYNPLFIYGGVGLGKTHLLQAIGHHVLTTRPNATVRYLTCERFTNEYIQSVRGGRGKEFKDAYRTVDVLLVDDVQFISGKQGTQEEFFHTFNALHQLNKQIVLSADRSPKDILSLESRLLSRFEWGMTTDISQPDFETRVAILEAKCQGKNYPLTADVLRAIAGTVQSNA